METKQADALHGRKAIDSATRNDIKQSSDMESKLTDGVHGPKVIDCAIRNDGKQMYKVKWGCTWETSANLASYQHLIDDFWSFIEEAKKNHQKIRENQQKPEVLKEIKPQSSQLPQPHLQDPNQQQLQQLQKLQQQLQQQQEMQRQNRQLQQQQLQKLQEMQRQQLSTVKTIKTEQNDSDGGVPPRFTEEPTTTPSAGRVLVPVNHLNVESPVSPSMSIPPMSHPSQANSLHKTPVKTPVVHYPRTPQSVPYSPHTPQPHHTPQPQSFSPCTPSRSFGFSPGYTPGPYSPGSYTPQSQGKAAGSPPYSPAAWSPTPPSPSQPPNNAVSSFPCSNPVPVKEEMPHQLSKNSTKPPQIREKSLQASTQGKGGAAPAQTSLSAVLKSVQSFENPYVKLIIVCKICNKESSTKFAHHWKRHYESVHGKETPEQRAQYAAKMASTTPQKTPANKKARKEKENDVSIVKREELMEQELAFNQW